jgi:hypothetical protein
MAQTIIHKGRNTNDDKHEKGLPLLLIMGMQIKMMR